MKNKSPLLLACFSIFLSAAACAAPLHDMALIPAGTFTMGATEPPGASKERFAGFSVTDRNISDEYPAHQVRITKPFYLSKTETTVGQFKRFAEETGYASLAERDGTGGWGYDPEARKSPGRNPKFSWRNPGYPQTDLHPVVNISYGDALAYIEWLSKKEGKHYRLPTEAEWEYAARAGSREIYSGFSDPSVLPKFARAADLSTQKTFAHVQDLEIEPGDPAAFPIAVGSLMPNQWGLYDMQGNVWEWVSDWHSPTYYAESPTDDPQGPATGEVRVRRGGAWNSFPVWMRLSFRNINTDESRCHNLGFRVARDAD